MSMSGIRQTGWRNIAVAWAWALALSFVLSCGQLNPSTGGGGSGGGSGGGTGGGGGGGGTGGGSGGGTGGNSSSSTPANFTFNVQVSTTWDAGGNPTVQGNCYFTTDSPKGSNMSCTIPIPEVQLFYSKTTFTISVSNQDICDMVTFRPYYYQASDLDSFCPEWDITTCQGTSPQPIKCATGIPTPTLCFSGPAIEIVPNFPAYTGIYFLTSQSLTNTFTASSANSLFRGSNRYMDNTLSTGERGSPLSITFPDGGEDGYIPAMQDYHYGCQDKWGYETYSMTMYLQHQEEPDGNPTPNNPTSNNLPAWDPVN